MMIKYVKEKRGKKQLFKRRKINGKRHNFA